MSVASVCPNLKSWMRCVSVVSNVECVEKPWVRTFLLQITADQLLRQLIITNND